MTLASLLKKGSLRGLATATPATPATVKAHIPPSVATVATVAVAKATDNAANDGAAPWRVSVATGTPPDALARLRAASLTLDRIQIATPSNTPDASCWPHSTAMNGAELDTFTARLVRFTDRGLILADAERLADALVQRDREQDDRRICPECKHFAGHGAGSWRCGNWQAAGIAMRSRDTQLPAELVVQLQRCDGFTAHLNSTPQGTDDEHDLD
ncbi:hypothetical protein [Rhodoferax sp.]|uniref:hypothetical protein n=1 Tax=Rhodoferax sp. TaxID=50421 RepID=UPI0027504F60|nr:hypothetical protein [Rhodoferax sp.]